MQQTIDIELFKETPQLFFSQLNKEAEREFTSVLEYFIYKYNINLNSKSEPKNKFSFFTKNPIEVEEIKRFTREELHER